MGHATAKVPWDEVATAVLAATGRRFSFQVDEHLAQDRRFANTQLIHAGNIRAVLGVSERFLEVRQPVTIRMVERIADHLGLHPTAITPTYYEFVTSRGRLTAPST